MFTIYSTPEEQFESLPDFPFQSHYHPVDQDGLKMHYLDEGNPTATPILMLHGEPSWSFLYRFMISPLVKEGFRVIVPDLIGFGKSDKYTEQEAYSYAKHLKWLENLITALNLSNIQLFVQDWGGLLGLRLAAALSENYGSIVTANTMLPTGSVAPPQAFLDWQKFATTSPKFDVATVLQRATVKKLSPEILKGYNAPFPNEAAKAGARIFPALVPTNENDPESENNKKAWSVLSKWEKPFLTLFSDQDPITKGGDKVFQHIVPGCKGQEHQALQGGHFIQEEQGPLLAQLLNQFYRTNNIH